MKSKEICRAICDLAKETRFVDPLTKLPPFDEISLSALLCIYHQAQRILWKEVPLILPSCKPSGRTAADIFGIPGYLCGEYPLFWQTKDQLRDRGGLRPDLLFISRDQRVAAFIENKIGASHKDDSYGGQFGRYAKYLVEARVQKPYLLLLTSTTFISKTPPWYVTELQKGVGLHSPDGSVQAFVMLWEDVLRAYNSYAA
ncbi:MAG: hypothetical protein ACUVQY_10120 [Thermoproteota archaeon]